MANVDSFESRDETFNRSSEPTAITAAVEIIKWNQDNTLILNENVLEQLLLQPDVKDRSVCVISIAGAFRQGKSLFLNFLLFYLEVKYERKIDASHWLDAQYGKLKGFHYRHGAKRDTEGILMYSKIYLTERRGTDKIERIAIILLDTQGAFDGQTTNTEFATLFGLNCFISSVQIYNVMRNIKTDDLINLECFAGICSLLGENSYQFQKLLFLVRDFGFAYDYSYGNGENYLQHVFSDENNSEETKSMIVNLKKFFQTISAFTLPSPGDAVASEGTFRDDVGDLDKKFVLHIENLIDSLLSPENVLLKNVHGENMTAEELFHHIKKYVKIFQSGDVNAIKASIFSNLRDEYLARIKRKSENLLKNIISVGHCYVQFEEAKSRSLQIAVDFYKETCGNTTIIEECHLCTLKEDLEKVCSNSKNDFSRAHNDLNDHFHICLEQSSINLLQSLKNEYEEQNVEFFIKSDFDRKLEQWSNHYTDKVMEEWDNYHLLHRCENPEAIQNVEEFLRDKSCKDKWEEYSDLLKGESSAKKQQLDLDWKKKIDVLKQDMLHFNATRRQGAIRCAKIRFAEVSSCLLQSYKTSMETFIANASFFANCELFIASMQNEHNRLQQTLWAELRTEPIASGLSEIKWNFLMDNHEIYDSEFNSYVADIRGSWMWRTCSAIGGLIFNLFTRS